MIENGERSQSSTRNFCSPVIDTQSLFEVVFQHAWVSLVVIADFGAHSQSYLVPRLMKTLDVPGFENPPSRSGH